MVLRSFPAGLLGDLVATRPPTPGPTAKPGAIIEATPSTPAGGPVGTRCRYNSLVIGRGTAGGSPGHAGCRDFTRPARITRLTSPILADTGFGAWSISSSTLVSTETRDPGLEEKGTQKAVFRAASHRWSPKPACELMISAVRSVLARVRADNLLRSLPRVKRAETYSC